MILLALLLSLPFVGSLVLLAIRTPHFIRYQQVALGFSLLSLGVLTALTMQWTSEEPIRLDLPWIPQVGLRFSIWLDGPALFWSWLVLGIGFLVVLYAGFYMKPADSPRRFYSSMMMFLGAMLGIVVSNNLILMFVFWELTSLTSFLLIGHWHKKPEAVQGAWRALMVTGLGGLALMSGVVFLSIIQASAGLTASLDWETLWSQADTLATHPLASAALVLLLLGAFTKSAQFPFHFWLPSAMEAPTPVSALLHAATMVKAGIYLLGRIYPIFQGHEWWLALVGGAGVATMLVGGYLALLCKDLKQLLAYSTVSQLGLLTAYYGFGHQRFPFEELLVLDLLLVASHALFKAGLFMLCGVIDHETGTRDWTRLGGLWHKMPATTVLTAVGCLSMAGLPFTLGFVAKKLFFEAGWATKESDALMGGVLFWGAILASAFTMAYSLRMSVSPFFGKPRERGPYEKAHEASVGFLSAPALLMLLCLAAGKYVPFASEPLGALTREEFYSIDVKYTIAMFKSLDFMFWISLSIYAIGGPLLLRMYGPLDRLHERMRWPAPFRGFFDWLFGVRIPCIAAGVVRHVQSPVLRVNTLVVFLFLFFVTTLHFPGLGYRTTDPFMWSFGTILGWVLTGSIAVACGFVLMAKEALSRVIALSLAGISIGGMFIIYKAPDLAITQILVELVILIMLLLLLRRVGSPPRHVVSPKWKAMTVPLAIAGGLCMGTLTYMAAGSPERNVPVLEQNPTHASFYLQNAKYPAEVGGHSGGGSNVVNVILVDFRALDTLGEITVLVIAALVIANLLLFHGRPGRKSRIVPLTTTEEVEPLLPLWKAFPLILRQLATPITLIALLLSIVLFFSGHNSPGGGFIAGLLTAVAFIPQAMAHGWTARRFVFLQHPALPIPYGLLAAIGIGLVPMLFGHAFLRTAHEYYSLPLLGTYELSTALVFDLGVYLVVVGIALLILKSFTRTTV